MECEDLGIRIETVGSGDGKGSLIRGLGASNTVCIGNGRNDIEMFEESALSVAVIGDEGCAAKAAAAADIIAKDIEAAFSLLPKPARITATLRR